MTDHEILTTYISYYDNLVSEYKNETVRPAAKPTRTTEKTVFLSTSELIYPTRIAVKHVAIPYIIVGRV